MKPKGKEEGPGGRGLCDGRTELNLSLVRDENVTSFDVSMKLLLAVKVLESLKSEE